MGGLAGLRSYDVFLCFRGEDTRSIFTCHLHSQLKQKSINAYMDRLHERAEPLETIFRKIEDSALSVIVFSDNFATSDFCLNEVVKIVDCNQRHDHKIFPVFYRVPTSAAQHHSGSYAKQITALERDANYQNDLETLAKVRGWREALPVAASHTGLVSTDFSDDYKFIKKIVEDVSEKLIEMSPNVESKKLVGMESRIPRIKQLLHIALDNHDYHHDQDTRIISFCGIGGSGKTTLAKEVFKQCSPYIENHYFYDKVTEKYLETSSLDSLMPELYSKLLKESLTSSLDLENQNIRARLSRMKVLIVLDDVDDGTLVNEILLGGHGTFDSGSKIIITSRNDVFEGIADERYPVKGLDDVESLQLFSLHAFNENSPPSNRKEQSDVVVNYCQNNPLALKVLGSTLQNYVTNDEYWNGLLNDLREIKVERIHKVLRVSYDRLSDNQKKIFLDIACFFRGEDIDYLRKILEGCYRAVYPETRDLMSRSLIFVSNNKLEMHDLIQKMGRDIVEELSVANFNTGTRLWKPETVRDVLKGRMKGVKAIEGMFLDLSKIEEIEAEPTAFVEMKSLRLLKFYVPGFFTDCTDKLNFPGDPRDLQSLPAMLRYLYWYGFPLECFPPKFSTDYLVELNLPYSKIKRLWIGVQKLPKLKMIDLRHSKDLTEFPDLRKAENAERINLEGCTNLKELHSSIGSLTLLEYLNLSGCSSLETLPDKIASTELRILDLSDCSQLRRCPEVCGELLLLNLCYTAISDLPRSFSDVPRSFSDVKTTILHDIRGREKFSDSTRHMITEVDLESNIYMDLFIKYLHGLVRWDMA